MSFLNKIFGDASKKTVREFSRLADQINALEPDWLKLSDEEKTKLISKELDNGISFPEKDIMNQKIGKKVFLFALPKYLFPDKWTWLYWNEKQQMVSSIIFHFGSGKQDEEAAWKQVEEELKKSGRL